MGFANHTPKSTVTSVTSSAASVTIAAENQNRRGITFYNDSSAILYLKLGADASTTSYTCRIPSLGYFETPYGYSGVVSGVWASANGSVMVTEIY